METDFTIETRTIPCQLVTKNRWLAGEVHTRHNRLIDLLNADHTPLVTLHEAMVVQQVGAPQSQWPPMEVQFAAYRLLFAVPHVPSEPTVSSTPHIRVIRKITERVVIGVGQYEILGKIHLVEEAKLDEDFLTTGLPFYAVTQASVRLVDGAPVAELPIIVVNRRRTEYIALAERGTL